MGQYLRFYVIPQLYILYSIVSIFVNFDINMILKMHFLFIIFLQIADGGKVLLVPVAGSPLRSTIFYGQKLSERGHKVTLLLGLST